MSQGQPMKLCPYCGRPIITKARACDWHDDLPELDPLAKDVKVSA
jgi:DNA-directed RNA polymerase subunit RPC12/RpoP